MSKESMQMMKGENLVLIRTKIYWWRVWVRNPNFSFPCAVPASFVFDRGRRALFCFTRKGDKCWKKYW